MERIIRIHLCRITKVLDLLSNDNLRHRSSAEVAGSFDMVPLARRAMAASRSLRRSALRELALVKDAAMKRLLRLWLAILYANMNLRPGVTEALDLVAGSTEKIGATGGEKTLQTIIETTEVLDMVEQQAANEAMGLGPSDADVERMEDLRGGIEQILAENPRVADELAAEFTEEERAKMGW